MTKADITAIHPIHEWQQGYIRFADDVPVSEVLQRHRSIFRADDLVKLKQLGDQVYAPGKWTAKDILQHLIDTEHILSYRALRIARNDQTALPGFDEENFAIHTNASQRTIEDLLHEVDLVRQSTIALFSSFDEPMLRRTGLCSNIINSTLALAYIIAGHPLHHVQVLRDRYFPRINLSI
ncbi:DinB family protein [Pedobacter faecalis]|uniref:DinB family protein n=1 Tax=Pedobacter faecalis TaxID=3041495 RepID=UPI002550784C|nr:DinB family protein [Pedobacter sp. ELA7]